MVSEFGLRANYAVETQYKQLFVYLAVHRKMGGLAKDVDTFSAVVGFNPK